MLNIEKGIPIPKEDRFVRTARLMEVGDSVFVRTGADGKRLADALLASGYQYVMTEVEEEEDRRGYRVWKADR